MSKTATWHATIGQVHNQIDFILTPQYLKSSINKVNTSLSQVPTSTVIMITTIKLKLETKYFMKSSYIQFDLEKLKRPQNSRSVLDLRRWKVCSPLHQCRHPFKVWKNCYSQQLKRSLGMGDRERRFSLWSQMSFWICMNRDSSWDNRST